MFLPILFQPELFCFSLLILPICYCIDKILLVLCQKECIIFILIPLLRVTFFWDGNIWDRPLENGEISRLENFEFLRYLCKKFGLSLKIVYFFPPVIFDRMYLRFQCLSSIFLLISWWFYCHHWRLHCGKISHFKLQPPCNSVSFHCI